MQTDDINRSVSQGLQRWHFTSAKERAIMGSAQSSQLQECFWDHQSLGEAMPEVYEILVISHRRSLRQQ